MIEKISCFAVVEYDSRIMLREEVKNGQNLFSLPGGTYEPYKPGTRKVKDKSLGACVLREVEEESNMKLRPTGLIGCSLDTRSGTADEPILRVFYSAKLRKPKTTIHDLPDSAAFYTDEAIAEMAEEDLLRDNGTFEAIYNYRRRGAYDLDLMKYLAIDLAEPKGHEMPQTELLAVA